jgi:hypothetical protein
MRWNLLESIYCAAGIGSAGNPFSINVLRSAIVEISGKDTPDARCLDQRTMGG